MDDAFSVIKVLIFAVSLILWIANKFSGSDSTSNHTSTSSYNTNSFSGDEILQSMNIESLNENYKTASISNFDVNIAHSMLTAFQSPNFSIRNMYKVKNNIYIKVMYGIPITSNDKSFASSFSISSMLSNDSVSIYGAPAINDKEREVFKEIANELIIQLSK